MMEVILAGHTLDRTIVERLQRGEKVDPNQVTPETIPAAYARISRDPRPVTELRQDSIDQVEKARRSNEVIVFEMSHHSVAEHVQLNFDLLGLSRLAIEALEAARLCSYTEKSQRYITLDGDYVRPAEFTGADAERFEQMTADQIALYFKAFPILHDLQKAKHPEMAKGKKNRATVEGWAKEDARYALNMATEGQLGFSANARNLEYVIRRLRNDPLAEVRDLGQRLFEEGVKVAPSLILLADPVEFKKATGNPVSDAFLANGRGTVEDLTDQMFDQFGDVESTQVGETYGDATLLYHTEDPDTKIIAAMMHSHTRTPRPYHECLAVAERMKEAEQQVPFIREALQDLTQYDQVFREFEHAGFTFELDVSSSEFAQWKRHRMSTPTKQRYDPNIGYTYPEAVVEAGLKDDFRKQYDKATEAFEELAKTNPEAAEFILTNGHRRRLLFAANLREIYHVSRLREDGHAQWEIRETAGEMTDLVRGVAPATALLACGKDQYDAKRAEVFCEDAE